MSGLKQWHPSVERLPPSGPENKHLYPIWIRFFFFIFLEKGKSFNKWNIYFVHYIKICILFWKPMTPKITHQSKQDNAKLFFNWFVRLSIWTSQQYIWFCIKKQFHPGKCDACDPRSVHCSVNSFHAASCCAQWIFGLQNILSWSTERHFSIH